MGGKERSSLAGAWRKGGGKVQRGSGKGRKRRTVLRTAAASSIRGTSRSSSRECVNIVDAGIAAEQPSRDGCDLSLWILSADSRPSIGVYLSRRAIVILVTPSFVSGIFV